MGLVDQPIERRVFETQELMEKYPPVWRDRNKRNVFSIACPPGSAHCGKIDYSRWRARPLPNWVAAEDPNRYLKIRENHFDYEPSPDLSDAVEWHINFADPELFVAYGSGLFAQDKIQVTPATAIDPRGQDVGLGTCCLSGRARLQDPQWKALPHSVSL